MIYCEDIIEDIGSVSDKYGCQKRREGIGRPRKWRDRLTGIYSLKKLTMYEHGFTMTSL